MNYFCHQCHQPTSQIPCERCQSEFVEEMATIDPIEEVSHAFFRAMQNNSQNRGAQPPNHSNNSSSGTNRHSGPQPSPENREEFPFPGFSFSFQTNRSTENRGSENQQGSQDMLFNIFDLINSVGDGFQMGGEGGLNELLNQLFQQHEAPQRTVPKNVLDSLKKKEFLTPRDCAICQDSLEFGLELRCKHCYHEDCIKEWFKQQNTCPVCRAKVCEDEDCDPIERPTSVPPPRRRDNPQHNRSRSLPRDPFSLFIDTSNSDRSPVSPPIRRRYIQPGDHGFVMMEQDDLDTSQDGIEQQNPPSTTQNEETPPPPRRRSFFSRLFHSGN
eukprot:NODE_587_length_5660_cov_0.522748.p1 type:complete len:328 gc:universal NODE_587_length_5660_cov_0.522748:1277-2260(+)